MENKPNDVDDVGDDLSSLPGDLKSMHVVETIIVKKRCDFFYLYAERQVEVVVKFCCTGQNTSVLGIDTMYSLCNMWVTDLCYQNKRIIGNDSGHQPVFLSPGFFILQKRIKRSPGLLWNCKIAMPRHEN